MTPDAGAGSRTSPAVTPMAGAALPQRSRRTETCQVQSGAADTGLTCGGATWRAAGTSAVARKRRQPPWLCPQTLSQLGIWVRTLQGHEVPAPAAPSSGGRDGRGKRRAWPRVCGLRVWVTSQEEQVLGAALGNSRTRNCVLGHVAVCPSPGHPDRPLSHPERGGRAALCLSVDSRPRPARPGGLGSTTRPRPSGPCRGHVSVARSGGGHARCSWPLEPRGLSPLLLPWPRWSPHPAPSSVRLHEPSRLRRRPRSSPTCPCPGLRLPRVAQAGGQLCILQDAGRSQDPPARRPLWDPAPCPPASRSRLHGAGAGVGPS